MAILAKVYTDEVEKETGNIVPMTDIPGTSAMVDALRYNPNAGVKKAGIKNPNDQVYTIKKKYNIVYKQKNNNIEILRVLNKYQNLFAIL